MKMIMFATMTALLSPMMLSAARAEDWKVEKVRETGTNFVAIAIDSKTGAYYSKQGYGFEGPSVQVYKDGAAFQAGKVSSELKLQGESTAGTYMTASGGQLYARTWNPTDGDYGWPNGNVVGRWDLNSGDFNAKAEMPDMKGENGYNTFNWGGFSGINMMQDQTGKYVLGNANPGTWIVLKLDDDLRVLDGRKFEADGLGYAFMKKGQLYLGSSFNSTNISRVFDFESGTMNDANINLVGMPDFRETVGWETYLSTTAYDVQNDVLYFHNSLDNTLYRYGQQLGGGVPEPASWAMLIAGFGLTGAAMRRRRGAGAALPA
ncbi:MAG: hypothetical protein RL490_2000 [Pseudomonadota bacterium]|jgi:autoaggregation protein RapA/B/C